MYVHYNNALTIKARELRRDQTNAEKIFWNEVRVRRLLGYKFLRQKPLLGYIADFYCAELMLVVEIDGSSHHGNGVDSDISRTEALNRRGIRVKRYSNEEVENNIRLVVDNLAAYIRVYEVMGRQRAV